MEIFLKQENVINITEFALAFKWFILPIKKSRHVSLFEMYVYMPTKCNGLSSCGLTVGRVLWRPKAQRLKQRINPQLARSSGGRATRQFGNRSVKRYVVTMRQKSSVSDALQWEKDVNQPSEQRERRLAKDREYNIKKTHQ